MEPPIDPSGEPSAYATTSCPRSRRTRATSAPISPIPATTHRSRAEVPRARSRPSSTVTTDGCSHPGNGSRRSWDPVARTSTRGTISRDSAGVTTPTIRSGNMPHARLDVSAVMRVSAEIAPGAPAPRILRSSTSITSTPKRAASDAAARPAAPPPITRHSTSIGGIRSWPPRAEGATDRKARSGSRSGRCRSGRRSRCRAAVKA